jgi:hypothetical protein
MSNVKWEKNASAGTQTYTAQVVVPVTAPKCKHLVPSFSTCFMSRSYMLDLSISIRTSNYSQSSLNLVLPLQVSQPSKNAFEDDHTTETGVDEFFTPRNITRSTVVQETAFLHPPGLEGREPGQQDVGQLPQSMLERPPNRMPLPGYSVFGNASGLPVRIPDPIGISPGCG